MAKSKEQRQLEKEQKKSIIEQSRQADIYKEASKNLPEYSPTYATEYGKTYETPKPSTNVGSAGGTPSNSKGTYQIGNKVVDKQELKDYIEAEKVRLSTGKTNTDFYKESYTPEEIAKMEDEKKQLVSSVGVTPEPTIQELANEREEVSFGENLRTGLAGAVGDIIPSAIGGVAGGAVLGGVAGGGVGAIPGAILGGISGTALSFSRNIKAEFKEDAETASVVLSANKRTMRRIISQVNAGELDPTLAVHEYNKNLQQINSEYRKIKQLTSTDLNEYLSNGKAKEVAFVQFMDNELAILNAQMQSAVLNPSPTKNYKYQYLGEE